MESAVQGTPKSDMGSGSRGSRSHVILVHEEPILNTPFLSSATSVDYNAYYKLRPPEEAANVNMDLLSRLQRQVDQHYNPRHKRNAGWIFLVTSLALECLSAAFDQVSSPTKPQYALSGMLLAITAVLVCISELVYNGRKERVVFRKWGILGCFYYPTPRYTLFGSLSEIFGLVASIVQCIFSIVQYDYLRRHHENPIKLSVVLIVFVMCLIGSRLLIAKIRCCPQGLPTDMP